MDELRVALAAEGTKRPPGWNDFAPDQAHPANSTEYADFYASLGHTPLFLEAHAGSAKVAQWLVCRRKRRFNPLAALFADCGPQIAPEAAGRADEAFVACVAFIARRYRPRELVLLKQALVRGVSQAALSRSGFRKIVELRTYVTAIGGDDELLARFHSSHRNDTRKALRDGLRYTHELAAREYLDLGRLMHEATGYASAEASVIEAIERTLARHGRALISGVFAGDRLSAASVILFAGRSAFYLYGASSPHKQRGATTYLHYENMRRLRSLGVRRYDFGGAGITGEDDAKSRSIAAFKERFGGTLVTSFGGSYR